ncbi:hypothetical protein TELCIR_18357 [Teladorsagia circumcincta]|uniref:Uncharacterized protein n=1 Tax=Teladorsagia circumcincta TaxID=45464 RepID=A0A2G9TQ61_TELCI|nr:hypothetical protein TELCIR_18357 [Teladorsagia circumcincta]
MWIVLWLSKRLAMWYGERFLFLVFIYSSSLPIKERRKSLGAVLDSSELEQMYLESDRFWESTESGAKGTGTGNAEIDVCLKYHLSRVIRCLQIKERRKSLGAVLDSSELEQMYLESDRFWESTESGAKGTGTGNAEIDVCLKYHLSRVIRCLQILENIKTDCPLICKYNETLKKLELETVTLDRLLRLTKTIPVVPSVASGEIDF